MSSPPTPPPGDALARVPARDAVLAGFHPAVRSWFEEQFDDATEVQLRGWEAIASGEHVLLGAPTGSGKTLAAFLHGLSMLAGQEQPPQAERMRVLYISPLRALNYDIERNLTAPLAGIARHAARAGIEVPELKVGVRTGDTPQSERQRQKRTPPDVFITTPESLYVMLTSAGTRGIFANVQQVIVDEIHALASSKRGTHLALTLERLEEVVGSEVQRIGLSATQRPIERVAAFLGGAGRSVRIIETPSDKRYDVRVQVPVEDMTAVGLPINATLDDLDIPASNNDAYSIWGALHEQLLDRIEGARSSIVFTNSRRQAERVATALNELAARRAALRAAREHAVGDDDESAPEPTATDDEPELVIARAHHGSVSRETRREMEEQLKAGQLPAIVATSSLELGIDMGAVDQVLHIESPRSVASGIQRIGRAGHNVGDVSRARIFPKHRRDLVECAAVTRAIIHGDIEPVHIPERCLDVLSQQLVAMGVDRDMSCDAAFTLVTRADPYRDLSRDQFDNVLALLAGQFPTDDLADLRPRIVLDHDAQTWRTRADAAKVAITNAGTIPDRGLYGVFVAGGGSGRVGELDEEMVHETRLGDVIVLGASSWRVEEITRDRVLVTPVPGAIGRMPFWHGEGAGRTVQLGRAVGDLTRTITSERPAVGDDGEPAPLEQDGGDAPLLERLRSEWLLDGNAAANLVRYVREQAAATGEVPSHDCIVVERFRDELGDWRVCILTPLGKAVHGPWAMAVESMLATHHGIDAQALWSDDGIALRLPDADTPVPVASLLPDADDVEDLVIGELAGSALFASRFREIATRSLLLPLASFRRRSPLWLQRLKAHDVLQVAQQHPSFPMILETYRECLRDTFDMGELQSLLRGVQDGTVRVVEAQTRSASPFAASLLFDYTANLLYDDDRPAAERRAQALSLDQALLRELLGTDDIRELLEPAAVEEVADELQRRDPKRQASNADQVHDLLRALGDLTRPELAQRVTPTLAGELDAVVAQLLDERRILEVRLDDTDRLIAIEDSGTYLEAFGVRVPQYVPFVLLAAPEEPLERLAARFARTNIPFTTDQLAARWGIAPGQLQLLLERLAARGELLRGGFLPAGTEPEWSDPDVLRRLRRRTLAHLRRQIEPIEQRQLARFLLGWHGFTNPAPGSVGAVRDALLQLEGVEASPLAWERDLLAPRLSTWRRGWLEELVQTGQLVWMGRGTKSGTIQVALFASEHFTLMAPDSEPIPDDADVQAVHGALADAGASFLRDVVAMTGLSHSAALAALWKLAEAGHCTNDTWATLRAGPRRGPRSGSSGGGGAGAASTRRAATRIAQRSVRRGMRTPGDAGEGSDIRFHGRWSLLPTRRDADDLRTAAHAEALLDCFGIVTRQVANTRPVPGGFAGVYRELARQEEFGGVRRGWFVEGLGGAQFALPEAVERVRNLRDAPPLTGAASLVALRASDPVQPYGTILPWPQRDDVPQPNRSATAYVVLRGGDLVAHLAPAGARLILYEADALDHVAQALAQIVADGRMERITIDTLDGRPLEPPHIAAFAGTGFVRTPRGVRITTATLPANIPERPASRPDSRLERPGRGRRGPAAGAPVDPMDVAAGLKGASRPSHGRHPYTG